VYCACICSLILNRFFFCFPLSLSLCACVMPWGEKVVHFLFAILTTKDEGGDNKLAETCMILDRAGVFHHTYDAKSGALYV